MTAVARLAVVLAEDRDGLDFSERAGFLSGKAFRLAEWAAQKEQRAFDKLVQSLRWKKWVAEVVAENGERLARLQANERERLTVMHAARVAAYRANPLVCVCIVCGTVWTPMVRGGTYPSRVPRFCPNGTRCYQRAWYQRTHGSRNACSRCRSPEHRARYCPVDPVGNQRDAVRAALADGWSGLGALVAVTRLSRRIVAAICNHLVGRDEAMKRGTYHHPEWRLR
jgi:hypothetical protein